jgi:hypothetical protein
VHKGGIAVLVGTAIMTVITLIVSF